MPLKINLWVASISRIKQFNLSFNLKDKRRNNMKNKLQKISLVVNWVNGIMSVITFYASVMLAGYSNNAAVPPTLVQVLVILSFAFRC